MARIANEIQQLFEERGVPWRKQIENACLHATDMERGALYQQQDAYLARQNAMRASLSSRPQQPSIQLLRSTDGRQLYEEHPVSCVCGRCGLQVNPGGVDTFEVHPNGCRCMDCTSLAFDMNNTQGVDHSPSAQTTHQSESQDREQIEYESNADGTSYQSTESTVETDYGSFKSGGEPQADISNVAVLEKQTTPLSIVSAQPKRRRRMRVKKSEKYGTSRLSNTQTGSAHSEGGAEPSSKLSLTCLSDSIPRQTRSKCSVSHEGADSGRNVRSSKSASGQGVKHSHLPQSQKSVNEPIINPLDNAKIPKEARPGNASRTGPMSRGESSEKIKAWTKDGTYRSWHPDVSSERGRASRVRRRTAASPHISSRARSPSLTLMSSVSRASHRSAGRSRGSLARIHRNRRRSASLSPSPTIACQQPKSYPEGASLTRITAGSSGSRQSRNGINQPGGVMFYKPRVKIARREPFLKRVWRDWFTGKSNNPFSWVPRDKHTR